MILVCNGRVITHDENNAFIENGAVLIEGNTIKEIGNTDELKNKYREAEIIDVDRKIIMPGLINTHHHIYSAFARGLNLNNPPAKSFSDILKNVWWRIDKKLTEEDNQYSAYTTLIECIKDGVTTVFDHHASPFAIKGSLFTLAKVAEDLGIRGSFCYEVSDRDGEAILEQGIKENIDFIKYADSRDDDMVKGMFGMHASFTLSNESLLKCVKAMEGIDAGYHVHVAEGIEDLYDSLNRSGKRVVERLNDYGILGEKTFAVHCIHVNDREMDILKETNTTVINNPESNMGNAVGCAPVIRFFEKGLNVGLGTDGYTSDIFESMKVENIIHKANLCNPNVGFIETGAIAFNNNSKIASKYFKKEVGVLREGAYADLIVVDYNPLTVMNENNCLGHILFGMTGRSVDTTIINGRIVMKDRKILTVDENEILEKSRDISSKLWKRLNG
ncbi:putative chlorohydrolase/aminohydrolase [uncultured Clostridium sp.]|uniref:putative aminohydrolase SsnA n=1 Tax=uncultured Clostridium sp. TaxID=59620 RepID=UPI0008216EE4|nr:putative aminohydrolase SsnA [uncultured Clostridium sp.]SCJ46562.1 putative chlorohydrolase/aminohydrolase [uncultured Clostridium sp.]